MATSEEEPIIMEDDSEGLEESIFTMGLPYVLNKIKNYLKQQNLVELNIGVTGESGSGKSTFVNAFRGLGDEDEDAAVTGVVETTMDPEVFLHPKSKNVKVWDLPAIGTPNFKASEFLEQVKFERYDFFIIIASDRFKECHTQLAKEIMGKEKLFYFVRSKIDCSITTEKRKTTLKNLFDLKKLDTIREDCKNGLKMFGIENPDVFLMSGWEMGKYDFNLLQERMEKELPQHKRHVLMLALPNITLEINERKKKALEKNIHRVALISACVAAIPLPGYSVSADVAGLADELRKYYSAFGLDDPSLQKLCERSGKTVEELKSLMKSSLHNGINRKLIISLLGTESSLIFKSAVNFVLGFFPIVGTVVAGGMSYSTVLNMLKKVLNEIEEDAKNVLMACEM
ncbi:interferon-inducible GTPase 5-like [Paramisgurnus dabryanus]|uniref:interferon-inducible GTPase 5-like n=1 Tax=Paramisgurnus dabryanus TaxID=90735 RepID=UPI0031F45535